MGLNVTFGFIIILQGDFSGALYGWADNLWSWENFAGPQRARCCAEVHEMLTEQGSRQ
jgi:hypothetical protein